MSDRHPRAKPREARSLRAYGALLALSVTAFCYVAMETLPIGILELISADLDVSLSTTGLLVTGYALTVAVVSLPLAVVTKRIPRRALLIVLLAVLVVGTVISASVQSYQQLLLVRIVIATSQALFWAVVAPTVASMFPVHVRGRVSSVVFSGAALAPMVGVPAGTWLGQEAGWRWSFVALAGLALVAFSAVVGLLPPVRIEESHAATGTSPDARRYWVVVVTTTLAVAGLFTAFTYTAVFLTGVSGLAVGTVALALLARGVADFMGITVGGIFTDHHQRLAVLVPVALLAAAHIGLYLVARPPLAATILLAVTGFAMGALTPALQNRVMEVAPGRTDLASAGNSAAFNVGIAGGSWLGAMVLAAFGVRSTALVAGLLVVAALVVALAESALRPRSVAATAIAT
jgi:MFS transporter, DHA1 family, inner membrane transport protein